MVTCNAVGHMVVYLMLGIAFVCSKEAPASNMAVNGIRQLPLCTKDHFDRTRHDGIQGLGYVNPNKAEASLENRAREKGLVVLATPCRPRSLTLTRQDGRTVSLDSLADHLSLTGRHMLVNVWATWCAPCLTEMPSLLELQADTSLRGLEVVTINQDINPLATVPVFLEKKGWGDLETWFDVTRQSQTAFGTPRVLPLSFVMNPNGHVVASLIGQTDWTDPAIKNTLRSLMSRHTSSPTA